MNPFSALELLAAYAISFAAGVASAVSLRSYHDHLKRSNSS